MRYLKLAVVVIVIATALLVFPNRIPEFAGLWLLWCSARMFKGTCTQLELSATLVWFLIKWPEPTWAIGVFVVALLFVQVRGLNTKRLKISLSVLWVAWALWLVHHHVGASGPNAISNPEGPVVCLGDSLTDYGYPEELEKLIQQPVADFGFNGYTTVDGLKLVPDIVALKPHTVVIELGGHDFKNGESRSATEENLRSMIETFRDIGARVVLVEFPRGFINDPWYGFGRQLAREYDLDLIPDTMIRRLVFWSPIIPPGSLANDSWRLSEDGLHPNDAGNRMMAKKVAGYLDR